MASYQEWRSAALRGAAAAHEIHERLGLRDALRDGTQPVDVFTAVQERGRTLIFQPLKTLLGAYIRHRAATGLIVTTERDLHMQRFTAAHELGHAELNHPSTSLDDHVGFAARGPAPIGKNEFPSAHEIEADAFASEFLMPKWLLAAHVRRRRWTLKDLQSAEVVYQLSLRLGVSYAATCWSLASNSLISKETAQELASVPPKKSKQKALAGFNPDTWRNVDIWLLNVLDSGARILGDPHDKLVVDLEEHASSGYVWDVHESIPGLHVERTNAGDLGAPDALVGNVSPRRLLLSGDTEGRVTLVERRPWDKDAPILNSFVLDIDLRGPESPGLPRAIRRTLQ